MKAQVLFALILMLFSGMPWAEQGEHFAAQGPITALKNLESASSLDVLPHSRPFAVQHWKTENGLSVWFVPTSQLPMLDVRLVFNAGAARDQDQSGLAMLTSNLVFEGTDTQNATTIARKFESLGAEYGTECARDMSMIELRTLTDAQYLNPVLNELVEVLAHANFPVDAFNRIRNQQLTGLKEELQSPSAIASRMFWTRLYENQPYGAMPQGTTETLLKIKPENVRAFYARYFTPANAVLALVGNLSRQQADDFARQVAHALHAGKAAPPLPQPVSINKPVVFDKEFSSEQTHILMGGLAISKSDPRFYALMIGNEILGGSGFSSMLTRAVRVEHGYSYSVGSSFVPMQQNGPFVISMQTRNDQAQQARDLAEKVVNDFIQKGPTQVQIDDAKAQLLGSYPLGLASNSAILGNLAVMGFYHLPEDYLINYPKNINKVTLDEVRTVDRQLMDPMHWLTIMVGHHEPS